MPEESAKLRIPYIAAAQAQKHVTHNEAMTLLDTLVQLSVVDKDLTAPPGSPDEGDCYIVAGAGGTATGAWESWEKRVARFIDGEWRSYLPGEGGGAGWLAWVLDEDAMYRFDGANWELAGIEGPPGAPGPSIAPDAVVNEIADRDDYDDEDAAFAVLVGSDASNGGATTLYYKLSAASADWSDPVSWLAGDASELPFSPTGDISATNVQAAIAELDSEKLPRAHARGHLWGVTLSNNSGDATNDIDIAVGQAASVVSPYPVVVLASALTKRLDATWSSGSGTGGRFATSISNATWHVFLISNGTSVDVGFSTNLNPTSDPNYPGGYTYWRRIGSILRESGAIAAFTQQGDTFLRSVPVTDVNATNPGTSAVTRTLSVPAGVVVGAVLSAHASNAAGTVSYLLLTSFAQADTTPSFNAFTLRQIGPVATRNADTVKATIFTNTSAQIRSRLSNSDADQLLMISTHGWIDTRGRLN